MRRGIIALSIVILAVAACGRGDGKLTRMRSTSNGPDEFSVLPTKPLQTPQSYNALPPPTPGGANLVDTNPTAEGIAALGGNPAATVPGGVSAGNAGLVNHAQRHGVTPAIRQELAVEDAQTRRSHGRVNIFNIGPMDDYTTAYKKQWLDAQSEKQRMQRSGVVTPSAPPAQ
ncbi:DUF3035 domain-containing protein [Pelagivirga sediminicola]|uniref:DUF3035 domain-containing protein n=1 Tax=Pelagivirga sediminicola TaxID=2170575 RepID=A0A2T7G6D3_9RHOB|nr:DUF3035 domain-containing protein [Pelagivirga sediminicola]PVA09992.1 DUF3035 domain-containing protein [Pelagivirga sediminicola]